MWKQLKMSSTKVGPYMYTYPSHKTTKFIPDCTVLKIVRSILKDFILFYSNPSCFIFPSPYSIFSILLFSSILLHENLTKHFPGIFLDEKIIITTITHSQYYINQYLKIEETNENNIDNNIETLHTCTLCFI